MSALIHRRGASAACLGNEQPCRLDARSRITSRLSAPAAHCQAAGTVLQAEIARQASGRSKGWGLVDFASPQFAQQVRFRCSRFTPTVMIPGRWAPAVSRARLVSFPTGMRIQDGRRIQIGRRSSPQSPLINIISAILPAGHQHSPQHGAPRALHHCAPGEVWGAPGQARWRCRPGRRRPQAAAGRVHREQRPPGELQRPPGEPAAPSQPPLSAPPLPPPFPVPFSHSPNPLSQPPRSSSATSRGPPPPRTFARCSSRLATS